MLHSEERRDPMYSDIRKEFLEAILDVDRNEANALIEQWIIEHGHEHVIEFILDPVLEELGRLWQMQGDVSYAQVYVSATIAEDIILKVLSKHNTYEKLENNHIVVIGNIEDDFHSLGRRLISTFLLSSGWKVIDLGNDITAKEFVDCAVKEKAKIIMVSAMMFSTAKRIIEVREEINGRGLEGKIALIVGGAVFNLRKDLWETVGADGTARSVIEARDLASHFFETLTDKEGAK